MAAPKIHWSVKTGHTSIYSTVEDLQKFADAVLNKELLSQESWNAILTNHGDSVGYGWFLNPQKDHKRYQINGRSPGFVSSLTRFQSPEQMMEAKALRGNGSSPPPPADPDIDPQELAQVLSGYLDQH